MSPLPLSPFSLSDYPGHCGAHHHPTAHLSQEEDPHCRCSHQRSQQVRFPIRALGIFGRRWDDMKNKSMTVTMLNCSDLKSLLL